MVLLGSVGSKVLGPGGDEVSRLDGDDGTVGVGDKSGEASVDGDDAVVVGVGVAGGVGERSSSNRVDGTASSGVGNGAGTGTSASTNAGAGTGAGAGTSPGNSAIKTRQPQR